MMATADWHESVAGAVLDCLRSEIEESPELVGRPVVVSVTMAQCTPKLRHRQSPPATRCGARMNPWLR